MQVEEDSDAIVNSKDHENGPKLNLRE